MNKIEINLTDSQLRILQDFAEFGETTVGGAGAFMIKHYIENVIPNLFSGKYTVGVDPAVPGGDITVVRHKYGLTKIVSPKKEDDVKTKSGE